MIGKGKSHYAEPSEGPFRCDHCEYFKGPTFCSHPVVHNDAAKGVLPMKDGKAVVNPAGCCNEFEDK